MVLGARAGEGTSPHQQSAETQQNQARLAQTHAPENFPGLIAGIFGERLLGRIVEQIHEAAVIRLLKIVERAAKQKVQIQFAAQCFQFMACAAI